MATAYIMRTLIIPVHGKFALIIKYILTINNLILKVLNRWSLISKTSPHHFRRARRIITALGIGICSAYSHEQRLQEHFFAVS